MADANTGAPAATPQQNAAPTNSTNTIEQTNAPVTQEQATLEAVASDPTAPKAVKVAAAKRLKALKIKVDGQEYEEQLPFEIDASNKEGIDYMRKQLQFAKVSQKRMGEKAQLENEIRTFLDEVKKNPRKVAELGIDLKKLAAELIEEEIANSQKSPAQLQQEKLEQELREERESRKKEQEEFQKREFERIQASEFERYDTLMTQSLEKSDLPKSPYVVKKMADYMLMGLKEGYDVTPDDVLPLVREEILEDIRQMAQAMPLETIEKLFGSDILTQIRKRNVSKAKAQPQGASSKPKLPDVGATPAQKKEDVPKKLTIKQLFGV